MPQLVAVRVLTATSVAITIALCWTAPRAAQSFPTERPIVVGDHQNSLSIAKISGTLYSSDTTSTQSLATQLTMRLEPDPAQVYLYVSRPPHGIRRIDYDLLTGAFSNRVDLFPSLRGNDIALRTNTLGQTELYASESYRSANVPSRTLVRLRRFVDRNGDGIFGSIGDTDAAIAQSIPQDSHSLNQIQILDNTLYVGNGTRTENGAPEASSDDTFGESASGARS